MYIVLGVYRGFKSSALQSPEHSIHGFHFMFFITKEEVGCTSFTRAMGKVRVVLLGRTHSSFFPAINTS